MNLREFELKYSRDVYFKIAENVFLNSFDFGNPICHELAILTETLILAGFDFAKPTMLQEVTEKLFISARSLSNVTKNKIGFVHTEKRYTYEGGENGEAVEKTFNLFATSYEFTNAVDKVLRDIEGYRILNNDEPIKVLSIDIETFSDNDISNGIHNYTDTPNFEILLFAYSVDGGKVQIIDLAQGEEIPEKILKAITDKNVIKTAYNAAFERVCIGKYLGETLDPEQWHCTQVRALMLGLPASLDNCGEVLKLKNKKLKEGKELIRYFSIPCKPTKVNGGRTRNLPEHSPEKWEAFKRYCVRDVEVELAIQRKVCNDKLNPVTPFERALYVFDQRMHDEGVGVDIELAKNAIQMNDEAQDELFAEMKEITSLDNPNSPAQLKQWLSNKLGRTIQSLAKDDAKELAKGASKEVQRVLELRAMSAKTSVKKYEAMIKAVCSGNKLHDLLQFYGAKTGRWAGRIVQVHNLPRNSSKDLALARELVKKNDFEMLELTFGDVADILSQLIRTAFVAKENYTFCVCDFSAIEARVIAWLAGEEWRLKIFKGSGKIYEAAAAKIFGKSIEEIKHGSVERAVGKISELSLGFGGGVGAFKDMAESTLKMTDPEIEVIVYSWRQASPNIVKLWRDVERAAKETIQYNRVIKLKQGGLTFRMASGILQIKLPSGRLLSYPLAKIVDNKICYMGQNKTTHQWQEFETYGGKLVENIVQAIARDCLGETILRVTKKGYNISFHVHDEIIAEVPASDSAKALSEIKKIFATPISFAPNLPLKGEGYTTPYYLKD
nr:MAG TPA: DNA polymerase I [Caudoviricetes sp.]